jgi:toxin FitB
VYVVDTNIVSELIKGVRNGGTAWVDRTEPRSLYLAATTIYEITWGLEQLPPGRKRARLEAAWEREVRPAIADRILPLDEAAAREWGRLVGGGTRQGFTPPLLDAQIAAIAIVNGMTVVTRDRRGFGRLGCDLLLLD